MMELAAEDFLDAATERLADARFLYENGTGGEHYVLTIYVAGVAVECVFRAFIKRKGLDNHFGHNLAALYVASGLGEPSDLIDHRELARVGTQRQRLEAAVAELRTRWVNNLRYTSRGRYTKHLREARLLGKYRGDEVKENARRVVESATVIVAHGVQVWQSSRKK